MRKWPALVVVAVVGSLALAAYLLVWPRAELAAVERSIQIRSPQQGSTLPVAPVDVIVVATDASGVAVIELSIDGEFFEGRLFDDALFEAMAEFVWFPSTAGEHLITVRARGGDGEWGRPDSLFVTLGYAGERDDALQPGGSDDGGEEDEDGGGQEPTTSTTSLATSTTTTSTTEPTGDTSTSTKPPPDCVGSAPDLVFPADGEHVADVGVTLEWRYSQEACEPNRQILELSAVGADLRLRAELPAGVTSWTAPVRLPDCTRYRWQVVAIVPPNRFPSAFGSFFIDLAAKDQPCL